MGALFSFAMLDLFSFLWFNVRALSENRIRRLTLRGIAHDPHSVTAIVKDEESVLVRGWVSRVEEEKKGTFVYLRTERYPDREFRAAVRRKKQPFGSMRTVKLQKDQVYPVVWWPADLRLEIETRVCFGVNLVDNVAFPVILEATYDRLSAKLTDRDFTPLTITTNGQHRWTEDT